MLESIGRMVYYLGKGILLLVVVPVFTFQVFKMLSNLLLAYKEGKCGFLTFITGTYLAPQNCKVVFDWQSPTSVSNSVTFTIKFFQRNHKPYPISDRDQLSVHITNSCHVVPCCIEYGDHNPALANTARVCFSAKRSGSYSINILVGSTFTHIRGSPFVDIIFKPLKPSSYESAFINHCSTVVCTEHDLHTMVVELRDRFGNPCDLDEEKDFDASSDFSVEITELVSEQRIDACYFWQRYPSDCSKVALVLVFTCSGVYRAVISFRGLLLKNGDFNIICLTKEQTDKVAKRTDSKKSCSFSARLLPSSYARSMDEAKANKSKSVEISISSKQLVIKEYFFKFFPKRLATFRVSPSTKFYFNRRECTLSRSASDLLSSLSSSESRLSELTSASFGSPNYSDTDTQHAGELFMVIDDGSQQLELMSRERNIVVALFTHHLLSKIGGSETFKDKQSFFFHEIRRFHSKWSNGTLRYHLKVDREQLLEQSMRLLRSYNASDWCRKFEIEFSGEYGLDWGGLRAEWLELVCRSLFDPDSAASPERAMFVRFQKDRQGLIHPNGQTTVPLSYFEFAGKMLGKALLDAAFAHHPRYFVMARFSRSFLAQLIGLRVNYRYFEQDDPDLYVSKVKYILDNNINNMDELCFVEEEYDEHTGKLVRSYELIPNGASVKVTQDNKLRYLDALAQYRLRIRVKDKVEAVLKGLNDLVPDNLLSIFDENELELLLCGAATYSVSDLKMNHVVTGSSYDFLKVVDWFWKSLSYFEDEEFARLLQFVTGCSHLPPGGFADLSPRFTITSSLLRPGTLPTAHTCFNQICLPDYHSFDDFDRSLRIAITEGNEGFGLV